MAAYSGKNSPMGHMIAAFKYLNADLERREGNHFLLV